MPGDKTQVDLELGPLDPPENTTVEPMPDDLEDTFRSGPPGSLPQKEVQVDDRVDTGEMLAAVETDDVLDDAGPTAKTPVPELDPPKAKLKLPRPNTLPPQAPPEPPKR